MEIGARSFGDNLNEWFRRLGRDWKSLLAIALFTHVPVGLAIMVVFWLTGAAESWAVVLDPEMLEGLSDERVLEVMIPFIWSMVGWVAVEVVATVLVYLASARIVAVGYAGLEVSWRASLGHAASRFGVGIASMLMVIAGGSLLIGLVVALAWALIAQFSVNFLTVFVIMVVALTTLVVLTWVGISVGFSQQVIELEESGPVAALSRSFRLVQGRWWISVGFILVTSLIASAASQALGIVLVPVFLLAALRAELLAIGFGLVAILQGPMVAAVGVAYAIWYIDLRARREPLMAEQLV